MKKFISFALALVMCISLLPAFSVNAAVLTSGNFVYTVSNGEVTITDYVDYEQSDHDVVIPSSLGGYSVTAIGECAFENPYGSAEVEIGEDCGGACIDSIVIPDSVTTIGKNAFMHCHALESVTIGNGVTTIGSWAFYCCGNLKSIEIPNSVETIGDYAFMNCDSLTDVYYDGTEEDWNKISIGSGNAYLTDATIHFTETEEPIDFTYTIENGEVTITGYTGSDSAVVIPDTIDGYPVTAIGNKAFFALDDIKSVTVPASVTTIEEKAFANCDFLSKVNLPSSLTTIGRYAFSACRSLGEIDIPASVTEIGDYAFYYCDRLTEIEIPEGVTTIRDRTFLSCHGLASISIPESVTTIEIAAFSGCGELWNVYYGGSQSEWNKISIASSNEDLTNATINFAKEDEVPIEPEVPTEPEVTYDMTVITEAKKLARRGTSFTYTVSFAGTYDGYSFEIVPADGFTITEITTASDSINVDARTGKWLVSVLGALDKVDSEKEEIISISVMVDDDAETGPRELSLTNLMVADRFGDQVKNIRYEYASIEVTDQLPGDINGDDVFNYFDVAKIYSAYRGIAVLDEVVDTDVNCDGVFNYLDVAKLYAIYRGLAEFK